MSKQEKPTLVRQITERLQNNRLIAIVIVFAIGVMAVASFTGAIKELASLVPRATPTPTVMAVIPVEWPVESGWVLIGDYDVSKRIFVKKHFTVAHSNYPDVVDIPRQGEVLRLTTERNLVILDFETDGLKRLREPPWFGGTLKHADYIHRKLPKGALVEVREVSMPDYPNDAAVVWTRVAKPSE